MTIVGVECHGESRRFEFDPAKTALIIIDMQRHFLGDPETEQEAAEEVEQEAAPNPESAAESEADTDSDMRGIIPRVHALANTARSLGCTLVHTREGYSADLSDVSPFRRDLDYIGHPGPLGRTLIRGEAGHDFVAELQPLPGELVIDKASFGAFYQTELEARLRARGITHLMLCGVTTQCCVHSTLREAVDRGFWCLTVADCCAASEPELHDAALKLIAGEGHLFGWITDLANIEGAAASGLVA